MRHPLFCFACILGLYAVPVSAAGGIYAVSSDRHPGGHHGHATDLMFAATRFVMANHPDGGMAASADPRICSMQRRLGPNPPQDVVGMIAALLGEEIGADRRTVASDLVAPLYCRKLNETVIRPAKAVSKAPPPIPFYVNEAGIPVSKGNRVFDLCVAAKPIPLELIRSNSDRIIRDHRGKITAGASCQKYHLTDGRWKHPDHPELDYFTFELRPRLLLSVPSLYVIKRQARSVGQVSEP